ncbi:MAG: hypothetical protein IKL68_00450 [Clostridia bacterium]|nr:hypothetical protein [Clostridia bacterium]
MAFEKKDDISYVLALRYTQEFVDSARSKGYITKDMYADYRQKLAVTGNHYEISMTHEQVKLEPLVQYYSEDAEGKLVLEKTTSKQEKEKTDAAALAVGMADPDRYGIYPYSTDQDKLAFLDDWYTGLGYKKIIETYEATTHVYPTGHIEAILELENKLWLDATTEDFVCVDEWEAEDLNTSPKKVNSCKYAYTMNENDMFTVIIKNTNVTPAALIYNMVTGNTIKNNIRVYVNYGGTVLNSRWYGKIDYTKMKHDTLEIYQMDLKSFFVGEKEFSKSEPISNYTYFTQASRGYGYMVEFEAKPLDTTDLQKVGTSIVADDIEKYNFVWGTDAINIGMQISVGLNGISILGRNSAANTQVLLSYPIPITGYTKIRVRVDRRKLNSSDYGYKAILYVNDKRVGETEEFVNTLIKMYRLGQGLIGNSRQNFEGYIRNIKLYYNG